MGRARGRGFRGAAFSAVALAVGLPALCGCTSVGQVTNLSEDVCASGFSEAMASILVEEGEKPEVARDLASRTTSVLRLGGLGPRPFLVSSPSGTDFSFFVEPKKEACLLRLYGRQKGLVSYTNDLTYIATRPVPPCRCTE